MQNTSSKERAQDISPNAWENDSAPLPTPLEGKWDQLGPNQLYAFE